MPADYDVFLSHAWADGERPQQIAEALKAAGLRVWFDAVEINDFASGITCICCLKLRTVPLGTKLSLRVRRHGTPTGAEDSSEKPIARVANLRLKTLELIELQNT